MLNSPSPCGRGLGEGRSPGDREDGSRAHIRVRVLANCPALTGEQVDRAALPALHRLWRILPAGPRRRLLGRLAVALAPHPDRIPPPARAGLIVAGEFSRATGLGEAARLMRAGLDALGVASWAVEAGLRLPGEPAATPLPAELPPARRCCSTSTRRCCRRRCCGCRAGCCAGAA